MRHVRIVPVGAADPGLLRDIAVPVARELGVSCSVSGEPLDPAFARHPERHQHHSTALIERLHATPHEGSHLLGVTDVDLYIPILTFVFGEAELSGCCAVVSYHRLVQERYGLPPDRPLLVERLVKEAVHELGHTAGLTHCDDYDCVMAASHAVEWIDLKGAALCEECRYGLRRQDSRLAIS
jgi:archaemetzincin